MKIATLLTQYLYTKQRLDLPGIGTFFLDPNALTSLENSKHRAAVLDGITFESNHLLKDSPDLIAYISAQSGKMKALAASDLESHLELAQQFLNIGKPFAFEGIGTLVKIRNGEFEYLPGTVTPEKFKDFTARETSNREDTGTKYESFLTEPKPTGNAWQKPVIGLLVIAGLGLAIWGGYAISRKAKGSGQSELTSSSTILPLTDTAKTAIEDSSTIPKPSIKPNDGNYKYVLEVAKSQRAFKRYKQLRTNLWEVKLETTDSIQYKLVLLLPSLNADTTRVLDSLTAMTGKRVYIEHQN